MAWHYVYRWDGHWVFVGWYYASPADGTSLGKTMGPAGYYVGRAAGEV